MSEGFNVLTDKLQDNQSTEDEQSDDVAEGAGEETTSKELLKFKRQVYLSSPILQALCAMNYFPKDSKSYHNG